jgi:hypothetical protein
MTIEQKYAHRGTAFAYAVKCPRCLATRNNLCRRPTALPSGALNWEFINRFHPERNAEVARILKLYAKENP